MKSLQHTPGKGVRLGSHEIECELQAEGRRGMQVCDWLKLGILRLYELKCVYDGLCA